MIDLQMNGKKVAVFGLGDQVSYKENYADATGEVGITKLHKMQNPFIKTPN